MEGRRRKRGMEESVERRGETRKERDEIMESKREKRRELRKD